MARSRRNEKLGPRIDHYRHKGSKRKNNPPAKIAAEGKIPKVEPVVYSYSPHLSPILHFDAEGEPDRLSTLLEQAQHRPLTQAEASRLSEALRIQEPWLEWSGKAEEHRRRFFEVDPVALHIHERVSTQAILRAAQRADFLRDLFADPELDYREAVKFYQHDVDWANRLILGDSLEVMSSLARRENLAGRVQMIYIDPPYGIKFASNFQPLVGRRDVKDKEQDLTREPEMVKAYRDSWHLGVHSYLSYLRDRLTAARELLSDRGSAFIQMGDANIHLVRSVADEVFGRDNCVLEVTFRKAPGQTTERIPGVVDYLLWYARDSATMKSRRLYRARDDRENRNLFTQTDEAGPLGAATMQSASASATTTFEFHHDGQAYSPPGGNRGWRTNEDGMKRLAGAGRLRGYGRTLTFVRRPDDFSVTAVTSLWTDTMESTFAVERLYAVQTARRVIERCLLMTTDPGDLVLDPTCGSGTTAHVAEQWGRRWITIDTSRVALAIARQRLLTAKYDYYRLRESERGIGGGLVYRTVPHITLKSIAQNRNLDPIFEKHEPMLEASLKACNDGLATVTDSVGRDLSLKLLTKQKREGKTSVTDADRRRWDLPKAGAAWEHWQVPFDTDPDWPKPLQDAVLAYRKAWRTKMDEINACIAANADQEELVDRPEVAKGVVRVSGPFTVEGVIPHELTLDREGLFGGEPESVRPDADEKLSGIKAADGSGTYTASARPELSREIRNVHAYLRDMIQLLRTDGVRFPDNRQMKFSVLDPLFELGSAEGLHAEGRWHPQEGTDPDPDGRRTIAVGFGPQHGPVTALQVEDMIRAAARRGYDELVVAGFSFDAEAAAAIQEASHPKLRIHMAHIRPDVNPGMRGLLKTTPNSQLFTVFGMPQIEVRKNGNGSFVCSLIGVDIYDPVENTIRSTKAEKVAAWFLDSDYDGHTFCITQAFFPDQDAWEKLARALKDAIPAEAFEAFKGTVSLPFEVGKHKRLAVKVIDPRGNEVMTTASLEQ